MPVQAHKKWAQLTTRHGIFRFAFCVVSRNPSADFLFTWIATERGLCPWPGDTRCGDKQRMNTSGHSQTASAHVALSRYSYAPDQTIRHAGMPPDLSATYEHRL